MRTRLRPLREECLRNWLVEIHDPVIDKWIGNSEHNYFWYANWRANRLARGSLEERFNVKERFLNRLKFGKEQNDDRT